MYLVRTIKPPERTWSTRELYDAAVSRGYERTLKTFQNLAKEHYHAKRLWREKEAKELLKLAGVKAALPTTGYSITEIAAFVTSKLKTPTSRWAMQQIADREFPGRADRLYTWPEVQQIIKAYTPRSTKGRKIKRHL